MNDNSNVTDYVTFTAAGQLFGLPIERVQDVFKPARMTRVPLAGSGDRGRAQFARPHRHGDPSAAIGSTSRRGRDERPPMAIGIECGGESFGLLVDGVGEVLKLPDGEREANPINLDRKLAARLGRRISARWPASGRARRRSRAGSAAAKRMAA